MEKYSHVLYSVFINLRVPIDTKFSPSQRDCKTRPHEDVVLFSMIEYNLLEKNKKIFETTTHELQGC